MLLDDLPEGLGLRQGQVVLGPASGAVEVDVVSLTGSVILGPALEVRVLHHPYLLEEAKRPVDR